jgi:hypothetical protein
VGRGLHLNRKSWTWWQCLSCQPLVERLPSKHEAWSSKPSTSVKSLFLLSIWLGEYFHPIYGVVYRFGPHSCTSSAIYHLSTMCGFISGLSMFFLCPKALQYIFFFFGGTGV